MRQIVLLCVFSKKTIVVRPLPEFQSLGSPETTEKEIDTVSPHAGSLGQHAG